MSGGEYDTYGEVTALAHELSDDTVEGGALEVEGLAGASLALLAGAEGCERGEGGRRAGTARCVESQAHRRARMRRPRRCSRKSRMAWACSVDR